MTDTARNIIRFKLTGPKAIGAPMLFVLGTTEGRYEQHLYNTLGPIELWALSTSAEDVAIRSRLYAELGAGRARLVLAANYPGGSARSEIRRRILDRADQNEAQSSALSAIVEELVEELVAESKKSAKEDAHSRIQGIAG